MSFLKNNFYSSSSDIPTDAGYDSLPYSDGSYFKKGTHSINNNVQRLDYITLPKSKGERSHGTYLFWTLVLLLFILAVGNLMLTFVILGVLRLGQGMESLEFLSEHTLIKLHGNADLDRVYKVDGRLESFSDAPLELSGDGSSVEVDVTDHESHVSPVLGLALDGSVVKNVRSFEVRHPVTGESIFSSDLPYFGLPRGVAKLSVQRAITNRVTSPVDKSLVLKSDTYTILKGSEGTHMDGKEIVWYADQDIFLKSVNRSIILSGREGVVIDMKQVPVAPVALGGLPSTRQYKLCVCLPSGKLFRLPVPPGHAAHVYCHAVDTTPPHNPCV